MEEDIETEIPPLLQEALDTPRDRLFILRTEQQLLSFIKDSQRSCVELDEMNSYQRLIAHTIADYYCLRHVVSGSSIIVSRLPNTRMPTRRLYVILQSSSEQQQQQQQQQQEQQEQHQKHNRIRLMKRRQNNSQQDSSGSSVSQSSASSPSDPSPDPQSLQERAAAYEKAKARIFRGFSQDEVFENKSTDIIDRNPNSSSAPDFPLRSQYVPLNNHTYFNRLRPMDNHFGYTPPESYSCMSNIRPNSTFTPNRQAPPLPDLSTNPIFPPPFPRPQYVANSHTGFSQPNPQLPLNGPSPYNMMMTDPSTPSGFTNNAFTHGYWNSDYRPPRS